MAFCGLFRKKSKLKVAHNRSESTPDLWNRSESSFLPRKLTMKSGESTNNRASLTPMQSSSNLEPNVPVIYCLNVPWQSQTVNPAKTTTPFHMYRPGQQRF